MSEKCARCCARMGEFMPLPTVSLLLSAEREEHALRALVSRRARTHVPFRPEEVDPTQREDPAAEKAVRDALDRVWERATTWMDDEIDINMNALPSPEECGLLDMLSRRGPKCAHCNGTGEAAVCVPCPWCAR